MSEIGIWGRRLLLLAIACRQPDAANNHGSPVEVALQKKDSTAAFEGKREPSSRPMRSPAILEPAVPPQAGGARPLPAFVAPYQRGAWRFADLDTVNDVVLWVDQILIRHDEARSEVSFNLSYWYSVPPPLRTREQALVLARRVADEAARNPSNFAALARRYSEDLPSRDEGGALGGRLAGWLIGWPHVLDALAAIQPGQTSQVVETRYGFHIFHRREPPPEQTLSGMHIVIGHDQAEWLKMQARGPLPSRSRDEALALATDLYRQAAAQPERFPELVNQYSEHRDALVGGDFGSWSTREANPVPQRMVRLEQLALGALGPPIETNLGFEVILRTQPPAREQYAVRAVSLPFDPAASDLAEGSRARVLAQAEAMARSYAAEPRRFDAPGELPIERLQWQSGRGVPGVELQLEKLQLGVVASAPVQVDFKFQIFERVAPEPTPAVHYATELPAPAYPDVQLHLAGLPREHQRELLSESGRLAAPELSLSSLDLAQLRKLHENAVLADPEDPSAATAAVQHVLDETKSLLGPKGYERYLSVLQRELASALLTAPADSPDERGI